ncbi:hypothetical protein ZWY2020_012886 [Hordeum vulgare]|nr:hypothetical protein ZWY2020_012886 [Hordeum vulgare]
MPPHERKAPPGRRMLALPTVCPCEAIARDAAGVAPRPRGRGRPPRRRRAPVLRRGAGEALRLARVLLAFLEEKLRFLLADCSRRGARLWVLMNADLVASELRVVLCSVATAMDVLPADVVGASVEAGELARLLSRQAWRAPVWPDADDGRATRSVRSMLALFTSSATPHAEDARRVLGRVGITSWCDCAERSLREAELLDRLEDGRENDNDLVLISGLMAVLVYCRVVLFDCVDAEKADAAAPGPRPAASCAAWTSQEALQCPISLELMTDPVTVATGQTYDRTSIKRWIKSGCRTCPVTGERLRSAQFVPNVAVRGIVEQLLASRTLLHEQQSSKHRCAVDKTASAFGPAAAGGVRLAVAFLIAGLARGTPEEQKKATHEVRKLAKRNVYHRACLVEADAVPWLLHLLSSTDASVQDNAIASLLNLSKHAAGRRALVEAGGLNSSSTPSTSRPRWSAAERGSHPVLPLAEQRVLPGDRPHPGGHPDAGAPHEEGTDRGRKTALVSLHGVLHGASSIGKAVTAGAVGVLANLLSGDRADLANDSVALLAWIAEQPAGATAILASSGSSRASSTSSARRRLGRGRTTAWRCWPRCAGTEGQGRRRHGQDDWADARAVRAGRRQQPCGEQEGEVAH